MTTARLILELPQHDSDREGTLCDVKDAIGRLKHVSAEVFSSVEERIKQQASRLDDLLARVERLGVCVQDLASQPSRACSLTVLSTLPYDEEVPIASSVFTQLPVQRLGEAHSSEHRFLHRRNADQDDDPQVPRAALHELDQRMANAVALKLREALEQLREVSSDLSGSAINFATLVNNGHPTGNRSGAGDDTDEEDLGPAPSSLQVQKTLDFVVDSANISMGEISHPTGDVGYRPRVKEANLLGLPSHLGDVLPDVSEPDSFLARLASMPTSSAGFSKENATTSQENDMDEAIDHDKGTSRSGHHKASPPTVSVSEAATAVSPMAAFVPSPQQQLVDHESATKDRHSPVVPMVPTAAGSHDSGPVDKPRLDLLAAIRDAKPLGKTRRSAVASSGGGVSSGSFGQMTPAKTVKQPVTLADEMREKLIRRQKALSGERDEEEQQAERARIGRSGANTWDDASSDSGTSVPSVSLAAPPKTRANATSAKRLRDPLPPSQSKQSNAPFAGLDALLNRELSSKSAAVLKMPPKPPSSAGDWDDEDE